MVVDGLQRLSTFDRFVKEQAETATLGSKRSGREVVLRLRRSTQNRVEDCNLIFYVIDSKVPERARLDIFERVNGGVPLTRQQMRTACSWAGHAFSGRRGRKPTFSCRRPDEASERRRCGIGSSSIGSCLSDTDGRRISSRRYGRVPGRFFAGDEQTVRTKIFPGWAPPSAGGSRTISRSSDATHSGSHTRGQERRARSQCFRSGT